MKQDTTRIELTKGLSVGFCPRCRRSVKVIDAYITGEFADSTLFICLDCLKKEIRNMKVEK